jgi:Brp/Blh family beta-carotene 15,15'-monooxygenase
MAQRRTNHQKSANPTVLAGGAQVLASLVETPKTKSLHFWLTFPIWGILIVTLILAYLFPVAVQRWQFVPFLFGMVFLGLPHGALDHLAPLFLCHRRLTPRYLFFFILGYGSLVAIYLLFWRLLPEAALIVFLLLSWLHWGQGDAYFIEVFEGRPIPKSWGERLIVWLVRGGLPIVLPPLAFPAVFGSVTGGILHWYGGQGGWHMNEQWRPAGLMALAALIVIYLWQSWRTQKRSFWRDAGEIGLLGVYFWLVPPILAVGLYFCVWHSARHFARLILLNEANGVSLSRGEITKPLLRTARQAIPMTIGALALLAGLFWEQGHVHVSTGSLVYLYLSLIAALTFPHFLLVLWMDREEQV